MNELPIKIHKAVARYQPIETDGLTLYPIKVCNYTEFLMARPAIEVMHQSLPVALLRVPLLSALYQIDFDAALSGKPITGLFSCAILMLALALRLGEGQEVEERTRRFQIIVDPEKPAKLQRLRFSDEDGAIREITPAQFARIRQIIAAQNGVRIESDKANPDIVRAEKDKASTGSIPLDINIEDWIGAISALSGVTEDEIETWPILRFQRRSQTYQRILDYVICGIGECGGMVSWPKGNPHPHPFFDRINEGSGILSPLGSASNGSDQAPPEAAEAIRSITQNL